jgi:hypothetical protein
MRVKFNKKNNKGKSDLCLFIFLFVCLVVFSATFNNISDISWQSVLLVEETGGLGENHQHVHRHHLAISPKKIRTFETIL